MDEMKLVWPSPHYLPSYVAALERGWSPDNLRGEAAAREKLERIAADADGFLASLVDIAATGAPITLPDGTTVPRLSGIPAVDVGRRVLWQYRAALAARHGRTSAVLPWHIGYTVVPWKRRPGYAKRDCARCSETPGKGPAGR